MQKHNHIIALFFLGIFSLFLLHQVLPHLHHQHEVEHTHNGVAHTDIHNHDVPEKESSKKGFLDLFLEVHMHSVVANEIVLTHNSSFKQLNVKKKENTSISFNYYSISINYNEEEKVNVYHPPKKYFTPYLSSLDSRGPPSLC
jgi:zinc transporter ZupT